MSEEFTIDTSNPTRLKRVKPEESDEGETQDLEDQLLEQDIEGNKRRKFQKGKQVDTTQYNEDSSDDDYEANEPVESEKKDDSDSDMFASDDEEETKETKIKTKKPKVEFLDVKSFEKDIGVDGKNTIEDVGSGEEDDDDEEDEEERQKEINYYIDQETEHTTKRLPKKEPQLDAFNLKQEQNEGRFDIDGNFIRANESDDDQDNDWLNGIKKKDIREAKKAQENREKQLKERQKLKETLTTEDLLFKLITLLQAVETPLEALQRLNKAKPKKKSKRHEVTEDERKKEELRKSTVVQITEYCESLIENGTRDVYELEREELMLKYKEESGKQYVRPTTHAEDEKALEPKPDVGSKPVTQWEFRWNGDDQIHGPYGSHEMAHWKDNYFQDRVDVRKVGETDFVHVSEITNF